MGKDCAPLLVGGGEKYLRGEKDKSKAKSKKET
jgi:hypothetical protein